MPNLNNIDELPDTDFLLKAAGQPDNTLTPSVEDSLPDTDFLLKAAGPQADAALSGGAEDALPDTDFLLKASGEGGEAYASSSNMPSSSENNGPKSSFMDGVKYGAKEATMPFNIDRGEQAKALNSTAATAGYLLSNLGVSLGMNAALTAATGAVAGPIGLAREAATAKNIVTGLYALYQGAGRDRVRTRDEGRSWHPLEGGKSTATTLLTTALELNPLLKASGKLSAALRIGAQGLGEAAKEKIYGQDNNTAAFAAAMGIVGAGIPLGMSAMKGGHTEAVIKDAAESALDMESALKTKGPEVLTAAKAKMVELEKARPDFNSPDWTSNVTSDFKRSLVGDFKAQLGEDALNLAFDKAAQQKGPKKLDEAFTLHIARNAFGEAAGEATNKNLQKLGVAFSDPASAKRLLMPMFYVSREIDKVAGTDVAGLADKFTAAHNNHNTIAKRFTDRIVPIQEEATKLGLTGRDVTHLITMEDKDAYDVVVKKVGQEAADSIKTQVGEVMSGDTGLFGYLKDLGYSPTMRSNYMPNKAVSSPKIASVLQGEMEHLPSALGNRSIGEVRSKLVMAAKTEGELASLIKNDKAASIIDLMDKTTERLNLPPLNSPQEFSSIKSHLLSGGRWAEAAEGVPDGLTEVSALFQRTGLVPEKLREMDAWKLIGGYINENLRSAHFEDAINTGRMQVGVLERMGMHDSSKFLEDYIKDQVGGARSLNGAMRKLNSKIEYMGAEKVRKGVGEWDKKLGTAIGEMPEFTSWLSSLIYPAKLALNIPGMIRNTAQFTATTIPELGASGMYGTKKAIAAVRASFKNGEKMADIVSEMEDKGLFSNHGMLATSEFAKAFGGVKGKIDKVNEKLFTAYQATDKFNRVLTWRMGREVAADILSNHPDAIKFVNSLDSATKQHLRGLIKDAGMQGAEKLDAVHDLVGRYLISKTQFDYSSANKADWARQVGPLFSMFTTWPAMVGGDMMHTISDKGVVKGGAKLMAKYLPYYGLATLVQSQIKNSDSASMKYLFNNATSYSPLDSVAFSLDSDKSRSGMLSSPILDTARKVGVGIVDALPGTKDGKYKPANPGALARTMLTEIAPTYVPIVSPILNELDRYQRIVHGKKLTSQVADKLNWKNDK
jgi:hypothetical protein